MNAIHSSTASTLHRAAAMVARWGERIRGRHELAGLDDRQLADIGITRVEVHAETSKPFWRD